MNKKRNPSSSGFTIVELMMSMTILGIIGAAIGVVIVDSQRSWSTMYDNLNSDFSSGGIAARNKFDSVMRKASGDSLSIDTEGDWIQIYYYASEESTTVDRYGKFYVSDDDLNYEYGTLDPEAEIDTEVVCDSVSNCKFRQSGQSVQMILVLDNDRQKRVIATSAVLHN